MVLYNVLKANSIAGTVIMPSNICESVPAVYMKCGLKVVFCDINCEDWQIDRKAVLNLLSSYPITVLHYNHTYGFDCEEDRAFLKKVRLLYPNILIVDDRCLCFPDLQITDANCADVILYSTGTVKCVDIGWGGYCYINDNLTYKNYSLQYSEDDEIAFDKHIKKCHQDKIGIDKKLILSNWLNSDNKYYGYYDKISKEKIRITEHKKIINAIYQKVPGSMNMKYCNWRYQILLENSKECIDALFDAGLYCSYHYKSLGNGYFSDVSTPNNNWLEAHIINLFNDFRYSEEQAKKTAEILLKISKPIISFKKNFGG